MADVVDDPREPDGGEPQKIESSCKAAYTSVYACFESSGYGSSGGAYGSSGSYDPGDYIDEFCGEIEEYAGAYGPGCVGAFEEVFACLASLDCDAISAWQTEGETPAPEPCRAVFLDASERCPESFSQCGAREVGFGGGCEEAVSGCLDGNTYAFRCTVAGATQSCDCERNGEVLQTVIVAGDLECGTQELSDELTGACEFPAGVF